MCNQSRLYIFFRYISPYFRYFNQPYISTFKPHNPLSTPRALSALRANSSLLTFRSRFIYTSFPYFVIGAPGKCYFLGKAEAPVALRFSSAVSTCDPVAERAITIPCPLCLPFVLPFSALCCPLLGAIPPSLLRIAPSVRRVLSSFPGGFNPPPPSISPASNAGSTPSSSLPAYIPASNRQLPPSSRISCNTRRTT